MKVTTKGQVTIPQIVREKMGIVPSSEIEFVEENGRFYLKKINTVPSTNRFRALRGVGTVKMSTEEIMALTRGDE